jgi:hypothetical protein
MSDILIIMLSLPSADECSGSNKKSLSASPTSLNYNVASLILHLRVNALVTCLTSLISGTDQILLSQTLLPHVSLSPSLCLYTHKTVASVLPQSIFH